MHVKPYWFLLILWFLPVVVQGQEVVTLTADSLQNGQSVELDKLNWKYQPGDDPAWADPQFDDRAWETLNGTAITLDSIPKSGWRGIGWFRLRLQVDPALANQPLALVLVHYGASEIYLDGKLVQSFGTVGATPETEVEYNPNTSPFGIVLDGRSEHVLAVRHSCMVMRDLSGGWGRWLASQSDRPSLKNLTNSTNEYSAGFGIRMQGLKQALAENEMLKSPYKSGFFLLVSGLALSIGLLFLLLFWFYPGQRGNLYFGLACCGGFVAVIVRYLLTTDHYGARGTTFLYVAFILLTYSIYVSLLAFLYTVFLLHLPKLFWLWLAAGVLFSFIALLNLQRSSALFFSIILAIEVMRLVIQSIVKGRDGAWIIGVGLLISAIMFFISSLYGQTGSQPPVSLGIFAALSFILSPSIFLARQFARTSLNLEAQLVQVKLLSAAALEHEKVKAENDRRAAELEEARQLQLSMLPKKLPDLPHLDIAAYMKTATEVGGDYYDFHLGEDGTLTIAVGDATGHGLKAGTMVTAVKSLFDTLAYHPDIPHIFERLTRTLKRMNLRGLFMAMTVAKINHHQLVVSIAGMPPVLIYRAANSTVEEVQLKALPLGGIANYAYQQLSYDMAAGDVIVLMSDGLPERFNAQQEMLGDEAPPQRLAEIGQGSAQEILNHLVALGEDWGGAHPPDDDVTFVVLKVKE